MYYCPNPQCVKRESEESSRFCLHCGASMLLDGKYQLVRLLGQGGMGRTYLAHDQRFEGTSNEKCVVKELKAELLAEEKIHALFRKEAARLLELRHEGVPSYRDFIQASFGAEEQGLFLVQQFIDGEDLDQLLQREGPQPIAKVIAWMSEALEILRYLHELTEVETGKVTPLLHLDFKPQNLMLRGSDQRLFVIDFGVAAQLQVTMLQTHGAKISVQGYTPGFAPYEQTMGHGAPATDLYAWAMTFLVLLSNRPPQELFDPFVGVFQYKQHIELSKGLSELLNSCLAIHLKDRLQSAREVLRGLRRTPEFQEHMSQIPEAAFQEEREKGHPSPTEEQVLPSGIFDVEALDIDLEVDATKPQAVSSELLELARSSSLPSDEGNKSQQPAPKKPKAKRWKKVVLWCGVVLLVLSVLGKLNKRNKARRTKQPGKELKLARRAPAKPAAARLGAPMKRLSANARPRPTPKRSKSPLDALKNLKNLKNLKLLEPVRAIQTRSRKRPPRRQPRSRKKHAQANESCLDAGGKLPRNLRVLLAHFRPSSPTPTSKLHIPFQKLRKMGPKASAALPAIRCLEPKARGYKRGLLLRLMGEVGRFHPDKSMLTRLARLTGAPQSGIRNDATKALLLIGKAAMPSLLRELRKIKAPMELFRRRDPQSIRHRRQLPLLLHIFWKMGPHATQALPQLMRLSGHPDRVIRNRAITALGTNGVKREEVSLHLARMLAKTHDLYLRQKLLSAMAGTKILPVAAAQHLIDLYPSKSLPYNLKRRILQILRYSPDAKNIQFLVRVATDAKQSAELRHHAIQSLGSHGPAARAALPHLKRLGADRDFRYFHRAQMAHLQISRKPSAELWRNLQHPKYSTAYLSLDLLERVPHVAGQHAQRLMKLLDKGPLQRSIRARLLRLIGEIGPKGLKKAGQSASKVAGFLVRFLDAQQRPSSRKAAARALVHFGRYAKPHAAAIYRVYRAELRNNNIRYLLLRIIDATSPGFPPYQKSLARLSQDGYWMISRMAKARLGKKKQ